MSTMSKRDKILQHITKLKRLRKKWESKPEGAIKEISISFIDKEIEKEASQLPKGWDLLGGQE